MTQTLTDNPTLDTLLARRSCWPLTTPAPRDGELGTILDAAARAPDHAGLVPWRMTLLRGDARQALLARVLAHPDAQTDEVQALRGKYTAKLTTAPVVLVLHAHIVEHPKAPEFEQLLAAGGAVTNMLNAAFALGYGAFWSSTPGALGRLLHQVLELGPADRMLGLLNLGTRVNPLVPVPRAERSAYVREWRAD
ncbi:MAG: putative NAD(P)H nitroreductase YdjA [Paracidovorax wautersii]|uniref:Putative NAD(P)H nitroreductase n=1 Tax=Paracidovorax wautersii TaxID=1177982 RepID=A0A7V8FRG3_9BURK|nr:MAG: putative NAD(P)H nitroreductase YdjA [Paracidovorax wautersii]